MQKTDLSNTSVSHDRHKCFSRCTQVSDTSNTCVYQTFPVATRICKSCGQQLPTSDFYTRDRLHTPDSYCKECRKAANRLRRKNKTCPPVQSQDTPSYLEITHVEEREVRLKLIMHALQTVHQSMDRQREKTHQQELREEWDDPCTLPINH